MQQHSKLALQACERVVDWAGPMSALLWPLFVSSCEAVEFGDREMARRAFGGTERYMLTSFFCPLEIRSLPSL